MRKSIANLPLPQQLTRNSSKLPNASYPRSLNTPRREIASEKSKFEEKHQDKLSGFSLLPGWLQLVDDQKDNAYPFPQTSSRSLPSSNYASKANSPLDTPRHDIPQLNSPFGTVSLFDEDDRRYWDEMDLFDGDEQNEDLEDLYRSFR